jgi:ankyrin repeat protein
MKSKKCDKCGFVCLETYDSCKSCGASFTVASSTGSSFQSKNGQSTKLAQASLAAAGGAVVWSRLHEQLGQPSYLLTALLLVTALVLALVALLQIRKNPFLFGGKRFAQSALAACGVMVLLYGMAIPSLLTRRKVINVAWRQYESDQGKFTVRMPGEAKHSLQYIEVKAGKVPLHMSEVDLGAKGACISGYADFSGFNLNASNDTVLDNAADGAGVFSESIVVSKKTISQYGYDGREVLLKPATQKYAKNTFAIGRVFLIPPRLYITIMAAPESSELYQERFNYLDSFRPLSTPLIEAAERGQIALIAQSLSASTDEKEKAVAFVHAAKNGHKETLRYLSNADVSVNAKDYSERTALMMAAAYSTPVDDRQESCVTFLIGRGANLDFQDADRQWTALTWSIMEGGGNATLALIKAGADVNIKDRNGETALTHAKTLNRADIVDALTKAGARE